MKLRLWMFLAALPAAAFCLPRAYADTAWTGAISPDMTDVGNFTNGLPGPGNGSLTINDISSNVPVMTADIALGWDLLIGTGANTTGRLDQLSGTMSTGSGNWVIMGFNDGSGPASATYNLADTTGTGGAFTGFAQGSGSLNNFGKINMGWDANTTSTLNVNTSGSITGGELEVGSTGGGPTSTFNIDNGTVDLTGNFEVGGNQWSPQGGNSFFNMSGGTITTGGEFWMGGTGTTTSQMTGGVVNSGAWFVVGRNIPSTNSLLTMTGGEINAATSDGWFVAGGFDGATGTVDASGGTINSLVSGIWIGEGANGIANLSGNVDVNGGWLRIGGNNGSTGEVNIIGSSVNVSATDLLVGLNASGDDTTAVGTLNFIADNAGISMISLSGDVNLSSPDGDFLGIDLSSYTGPFVDLQLIDGVTSQGEFTGLPQGSLIATGGLGPYAIDYSVGGEVWIRAVPEPSTLLLAGLGSLALFVRRRS